MLTGLFKTNTLRGIIALFFLEILFFILPFMRPMPEIQENGTLLYQHIFGTLNEVKPASLWAGFITIFIESVAFHFIMLRTGIPARITWLPAASYLIVSCINPAHLYFNAPLLANGFILAGWFFLLYDTGGRKNYASVFNAALMFSIGSLFYLPLVFFLPFLWIAALALHPPLFREILIILIGFLLPYIYVEFWYIWNGFPTGIYYEFLEPFFGFPNSFFPQVYSGEIVVWSTLVVVLFLSIGVYQAHRFEYKAPQRKIGTTVWVFAIWGNIALAFTDIPDKQLQLVFCFPLGLFFSFYFFHAQNGWIRETAFALLLIAAFILQIEIFG